MTAYDLFLRRNWLLLLRILAWAELPREQRRRWHAAELRRATGGETAVQE